jgi:hypothetical protein
MDISTPNETVKPGAVVTYWQAARRLRHAASSRYTSQEITSNANPGTTRNFYSDISLGESYEERWREIKAASGETWLKNPALDLPSRQRFDFKRLYPGEHITAEIKADLRARDRIVVEHAALIHSTADIWVQWIEPLQQFVEVPRTSLINLLLDQERRIRKGLPHYYRGPVGQCRSNGTRAMGTCIPIQQFLRLKHIQPS